MELNHKTLGYVLIVFSVLLLVVLAFVKSDFDEQSEIVCESYTLTHDSMEGCPVHENNTSWLITIAFGIAFLILSFGVYLVFMPTEKSPIVIEKKEFKQVDLSKLDADEKKVYEIIKGKGGSAYQSDLVNETSFTKVKVTRILDKLEMMEVLERRRRGMTNIIVLK